MKSAGGSRCSKRDEVDSAAAAAGGGGGRRSGSAELRKERRIGE